MQVATIVEQIRPLVQELNLAERLELIRSITLIEPAKPMPATPEDELYARLLVEQEAWLARPTSDRQSYLGEYVAVYHGEVVEHDPDARTLYLRVRGRFASTPILIIQPNGDIVTEFTAQFVQPSNRQALALLATWQAEPEEHDPAWWDQLESELRKNRFSLEKAE